MRFTEHDVNFVVSSMIFNHKRFTDQIVKLVPKRSRFTNRIVKLVPKRSTYHNLMFVLKRPGITII